MKSKRLYWTLFIFGFILLPFAGCFIEPSGESSNGGHNYSWSQKNVPGSMSQKFWTSITMSSDGTRLAACCNDYIYTSIDGGGTWTEHTSAGNRFWTSIKISHEGNKIGAVATKEKGIFIGIK